MARRRKNILPELITSLAFLAILFFYAIPKFQQTLINSTQQILNQSMQISQNAFAK